MGMFSWECLGCKKSILGPYVLTKRNRWMNQAVALREGGTTLIGDYDGYGRIAGGEIDDAGMYHLACWLAAGKPSFTTYSSGARDQGHFIKPEDYELDPPSPPNELDKYTNLKEWLTKHNAKLMWSQKMNVSKLGPIQQDCWLIGNGYAMVFYWPTSWSVFTAAPFSADVLPDAEARLLSG